jgi:hypothetical protein
MSVVGQSRKGSCLHGTSVVMAALMRDVRWWGKTGGGPARGGPTQLTHTGPGGSKPCKARIFTSLFWPLLNKTKECEALHLEAATSFPTQAPSLSGLAKARPRVHENIVIVSPASMSPPRTAESECIHSRVD